MEHAWNRAQYSAELFTFGCLELVWVKSNSVAFCDLLSFSLRFHQLEKGENGLLSRFFIKTKILLR
jgi:hypothetical protein